MDYVHHIASLITEDPNDSWASNDLGHRLNEALNDPWAEMRSLQFKKRIRRWGMSGNTYHMPGHGGVVYGYVIDNIRYTVMDIAFGKAKLANDIKEAIEEDGHTPLEWLERIDFDWE